jgi:hypothetical protein
MSRRRHQKTRSVDTAETERKTTPHLELSVNTKSPEKYATGGDLPMSHPAKPTTLQKSLLAAAIILEIVWIVFLVVLAAIK